MRSFSAIRINVVDGSDADDGEQVRLCAKLQLNE